MPDRDPIEVLQDAWAQLDSPNATPDLQSEDAETQSSVAWMNHAWRQVEIPTPALPKHARLWRFPTYLASAAAALVVSTLAFFFQPTAKPEGIATPSIVVAAPIKAASPKLLVNDKEKMQVLAGKVRLTMLKDSGTSNLHNTDS